MHSSTSRRHKSLQLRADLFGMLILMRICSKDFRQSFFGFFLTGKTDPSARSVSVDDGTLLCGHFALVMGAVPSPRDRHRRVRFRHGGFLFVGRGHAKFSFRRSQSPNRISSTQSCCVNHCASDISVGSGQNKFACKFYYDEYHDDDFPYLLQNQR
jgi:hypothetical protein